MAEELGYDVYYEVEVASDAMPTGNVDIPSTARQGKHIYLDNVWVKKGKILNEVNIREGIRSGTVRVFDLKTGEHMALTDEQKLVLGAEHREVKILQQTTAAERATAKQGLRGYFRGKGGPGGIRALRGIGGPAKTVLGLAFLALALNSAYAETGAARADMKAAPPRLESAARHAANAADAFIGVQGAYAFGTEGGGALREANLRTFLLALGYDSLAERFGAEDTLGSITDRAVSQSTAIQNALNGADGEEKTRLLNDVLLGAPK